MKTQVSEKLYQRALAVIPGGVNSPVRAFRSVGGTPLFMETGTGCRVRDADGNEFIDFCNSWGPLLLGHRPREIVEAVRAQAERALSFGTPCAAEVELAEFALDRLRPLVPGIERIRFVNSGTEAVMSALRLARGFTNRARIIKFEGCYHGHSDSLLVKAGSGLATFGVPSSAGVPENLTKDTIVLPLADEEALKKTFQQEGDQIAAVIIEPIPANNGLLLQSPEYLRLLRELCDKHGALLILDEVISGFRVGFGGAAAHYGIRPDLVTYGKIIGGGMPVGAFAGRAEIFAKLAPDGPVYQAGTLSGNPMAMVAGLAQLKLLVPAVYERLEQLGGELESGFQNGNSGPWRLRRIASIFWFYRGEKPPARADEIDAEAMTEYAKFHRHALERGVYLAPSGYEVGFLSLPMSSAEIRTLIDTALDFFG